MKKYKRVDIIQKKYYKEIIFKFNNLKKLNNSYKK